MNVIPKAHVNEEERLICDNGNIALRFERENRPRKKRRGFFR